MSLYMEKIIWRIHNTTLVVIFCLRVRLSGMFIIFHISVIVFKIMST